HGRLEFWRTTGGKGGQWGLFLFWIFHCPPSLNHRMRNGVYAPTVTQRRTAKQFLSCLVTTTLVACARPATPVPVTLPCGKSALTRGSTAPRNGGRNRARMAHELPLALSFRHKAAGRHQEISG